MEWVGYALLVIASIGTILWSIIFCVDQSNYFEMFLFEHKKWKLWNYLQDNVDKFQYSHTVNGWHYYTWDEYRAAITEIGYAAVFKNDDCCLSWFSKKQSKKFAESLSLLPKEKKE